MARKNVKVKDHENLSDSNIEKVMALLDQEKPITKKEACAILNISYNTKRLANIIEGYIAKKAHIKKMRDRNRGKPASDDEIQTIVKEYLTGTPVAEIAKMLFRNASFVRGVLERFGVPEKVPKTQRKGAAVLPDRCVSEEFREGQIAWSAAYHAPCEILKENTNMDYETKYGAKSYSIYVYEPMPEIEDFQTDLKTGGFYAHALAYDLGTLDHLLAMGINIT